MAKADSLSARKVAEIKKPGMYCDGHGLYLQVTKTETSLSKSWLLRYTRDGHSHYMGLGGLHTVSLSEARVRARQARQTLLDGVDPIKSRREARDAAKREREAALTFRECADKYLAMFAPTWRSGKHRSQWEATLTTYAFPVIGDRKVAEIETTAVLKVIEPLWKRAPDTANRLRGRIERVLTWAAAQNLRSKENPARWVGHLDQILPAKSAVRAPKHHPALPYRELPQFMAKLRARKGIAARALEFAILTAARSGEVTGARRSEIKDGVWDIPGERMKSGKRHRVPLCKRALEIIETAPSDGSDLLFPGIKQGKPMGNTALFKILAALAGKGVTTAHGFRSTFSDWARETTHWPRDVVERSLAHRVTDQSEAAYHRGDVLEKRRVLMAEWEDYCGAVAADATVTSLAQRRAKR